MYVTLYHQSLYRRSVCWAPALAVPVVQTRRPTVGLLQFSADGVERETNRGARWAVLPGPLPPPDLNLVCLLSVFRPTLELMRS